MGHVLQRQIMKVPTDLRMLMQSSVHNIATDLGGQIVISDS
jgi:hypothetical protein